MNGELLHSGIRVSRHFIWKVPKFFDLPIEPDYYFLQSPEFRFAGSVYCLRLYPNGAQVDSDQEDETTDDLIQVVLFRLSSSVPEIDITYEIGYKSDTGDEVIFEDNDWSHGSVGGIIFSDERYVFEEEKDTFVPDGILTLYCRIRISSELSVASLHGVQKQKESPGKKSVQISDLIPENLTCLENLSLDLSKLVESGTETDVQLKCGDVSIGAHKLILGARSEVFRTMMQSDMAEGREGIVEIKDMEPELLNIFIRYIYTGNLPDLTVDTALPIYEAADKYQVEALKKRISQFLVKNLSPENALGIFVMADAHSDSELKDQLMHYIIKEKVPSRKMEWLKFCNESPKLAVEVLNFFYDLPSVSL